VNLYFAAVIIIILGEYFIDLIAGIMNVRHASSVLPSAFRGYYDAERYRMSQEYLKTNTRYSLVKNTITTAITLLFILAGGFNWVDRIARSFQQGPVVTGLIFAGILMLAAQFLAIPFSLYRTFVIEERFKFNRTSFSTFFLDIAKRLGLLVLIGGPIFSGIVWFFERTGALAWLYCWIGVTVVQFVITFIAPIVIMPLFNKFIPLEDGDLKRAIEEYARAERFSIGGIFKMDGSRRSSKSNAFFTGFGKFRRIALFDTLIAKHSTEELVSILAHEIGHYKKRHVVKTVALSALLTGIKFFILSFFINNTELFAAFGMEKTSVYASLVFFGFLYTPITMIFSLGILYLFRKHEYEADRYVVSTYKKPDVFIEAIKKLTVDNLSNLTPHPLTVWLHYTHPPVMKRIEAIQAIDARTIKD